MGMRPTEVHDRNNWFSVTSVDSINCAEQIIKDIIE